MKVCLYGGTFDPPHRAHRAVVEAAHAQLGLDCLVVLPSGQHPFKADGAHVPGPVRAELCRLAFRDLGFVTVDERELHRAGPSYTVDTLTAYRAGLAQSTALYFLIGSDNVASLPQWRRHHDALALARFVVVPRAGFPMPPAGFDRLDLTAAERQGLLAHVLAVEPSAISSSEVRRRFAQRAEVADLLQPEVLAEIRRRHLYGT